ncbi:MAG: hypothetical protein R3F07_12230 [Opitutaceae bacterium]
MIARIVAASLLACLAALLAACSTNGTRQASAAQPVRITRGMTADRVYDLLGKPDEIIVNNGNPGIESETWIYIRTSHLAGTTQVSMRETVVFDSIANEARIVQEPITTPMTSETVERLELIMVMGEVAGWKQLRTSDQDFAGN